MGKTYEEIKGLMELYDDLPEGAFMAVMEENGVGVDDMAAISEQLEKDWAEPTSQQEEK